MPVRSIHGKYLFARFSSFVFVRLINCNLANALWLLLPPPRPPPVTVYLHPIYTFSTFIRFLVKWKRIIASNTATLISRRKSWWLEGMREGVGKGWIGLYEHSKRGRFYPPPLHVAFAVCIMRISSSNWWICSNCELLLMAYCFFLFLFGLQEAYCKYPVQMFHQGI